MVDSYAVPVTDDIAAHLIIEVDGNNMDVLMSEMEQIAELMGQYEGGEVFFADDAQQKAELWKLRRRTAEAVKMAGYTIEEDTVVPRAELPALVKGVKELGIATWISCRMLWSCRRWQPSYPDQKRRNAQ